MKFINKSNGQIFLFINALLWGSSYIWSKMLLSYIPRFSILFITAVAGLIVTAIMFYPSLRHITMTALLVSLAVSGLSILSNTFCMFALQYTSSSNTAFIVQMSVVMTPLIMALVEKRKPEAKIVIGSIIALIGIFLLTSDISSFRLRIGDILALCNALFFSLYLVGLKVASNKVNPVHFTLVHHTINSVVFLILALSLESRNIDFGIFANLKILLLLAASSLVVIFTTLTQSASIKYVRPEKATIIYTIEPVTAALLAFALLGETLSGIKAVFGCTLILAAVVLSTVKIGKRKHIITPDMPKIGVLDESLR